eukprot:m.96591 g.96591  ORF g.96591 m.96591 type:complete len:564 (+) comp13552_c0_seq2:428-2119(+)
MRFSAPKACLALAFIGLVVWIRNVKHKSSRSPRGPRHAPPPVFLDENGDARLQAMSLRLNNSIQLINNAQHMLENIHGHMDPNIEVKSNFPKRNLRVAPVQVQLKAMEFAATSYENNSLSFPIKHTVQLSDEELNMCKRTLWNARDTCVKTLPSDHPEYGHGHTFVITGDIDDMWLRDSAAQVNPYIPMTATDSKMASMIEGLILRQSFYINYDPYANAFRIDQNYKFSAVQNQLGRHGYISTYDYELDSGCYFMRLIYKYWKANREAAENLIVSNPDIKKAVKLMVNVWKAEQHHEEDVTAPGRKLYRRPKVRPEAKKPWTGFKGLDRNGKGSPVKYTGMIWSAFRPSDDEQTYGYLVPSNMFAVVALGYMEEVAKEIWKDETLQAECRDLKLQVDKGIKEYAIYNHPTFGEIYSYEVDGLGNHLLMDDANVPSLLSVPYLGYKFDPKIYTQTRKFVLSENNPSFRKSRNGDIAGVGSPHTAKQIPNGIWHMSLIMQGLTEVELEKKLHLLRILTQTTGGTGLMHEAFNPDSPRKFTRKWFSWANSLFAEFVMSLSSDCGKE